MQQELPEFEYEDLIKYDSMLLDWLRTLRDSGITMLRRTPGEKSSLEILVNRISFVRRTNFGEFFEVKNLEETNTNANTALRLPLHCDLPTRELQPGFQFLHCLRNSVRGGVSLIEDGFRIAETLSMEKPEFFRILSSVKVEFRNTDRECDYRFKSPMIVLDDEGSIREIRAGNFLKGPFTIPTKQMKSFYDAYCHFHRMLSEERFLVRFLLSPGDLQVFDNRRVLHAREAFDPDSGNRWLHGCYVDTDEILSRIRVLERNHTQPV